MKLYHLVIREIFYAATFASVAFMIMEVIWPNIVLAYFNINLILIFWFVIGIVMVISNGKGDDNHR